MLKKQKLLVGICAPMAALTAVAGVSSALLIQNKKATTKGDFKLSFVTDEESHFVDETGMEQNVYSGTTLDRVNQPQVQSYRNNLSFTGWVDENDKPVPGQFKILRNSKLKAAFADTTTGDYVMVTFKTKPTETGPKLHGNVSVAVKKNYLFMMINRPSAEWGNNYFNNWQYYDEESKDYVDMPETKILDKDITIYPKFTKAATITWNPGKGGMILRGQETTRLSSGTAFGSFNQPQLYNSDLNKIFAKWTYDEGGTQPIDERDTIDGDKTVYAQWKDSGVVSQGYHMLSFEQNSWTDDEGNVHYIEPAPIFSPTETVVVEGDHTIASQTQTKWGDVVKPTVSTSDGSYEVEQWQYLDQTGDTAEWKELTDDTEFFNFKKGETTITSTRIRPIMKRSISGVVISGPDTVLPESENQYAAAVTGSDDNPYVSQNVKWGVYFDSECKNPVTDESVSITNGKLKVKSLTTSRYYYIKATSTVKVEGETEISAVKPVYLQMPYIQSQKIWFHDGKQWFSMAQKDGLCVDGDITAKALNAEYGTSSTTIVRSVEFTNSLYIGRQLKSLYDQFGYNWKGFNGTIDFGDNNITKIGNSFLEGCVNFNQTLNLSKVTEIGANFLYGCTSFGDPGTLKQYDAVITLGNSLTSINNNFLGGCTNYNRKLTLPNTAMTIGDGFLYNCVNFNQDIEIPSNIEHIEDFFMTNCNSFTSTITVNCATSNFVENIHNISSTSSGADIYNYGFKVDGSSKTTFSTTYPTHNTNDSYRKIKKDTPTTGAPTKLVWDAAVKAQLTSDYSTANYTVKIPQEMEGGATIKVDKNQVYTVDSQDLQIKQGSDFNNIWKDYSLNESTGVYEISYLDDKSILYYAMEKYFYTGFSKLPYTDGSEDDPYWEYDSSTNKVKNKQPFISYEGMEADVEVEFEDDVIKYLTLIATYEGEEYRMTWTFEDVGTTTIKASAYDTSLNKIDTKIDEYSAYTSNSFTCTEDYSSMYVWFRNTDVGLIEKSAIRISLWSGYGTEEAKMIPINNTNNIQMFDSNGNSLDILEYLSNFEMLADGSCQVTLSQSLPEGTIIASQVSPESKYYDTALQCKFEYVDSAVEFTTCGWSDICQWAQALEAGKITDAQFCAHYKINGKDVTSLSDFIGQERTVSLNGIDHTVRIIGVQHDRLSSSTTTEPVYATFTFDSKTLLSNTDGTPATSKDGWDWLNYPESTLHKALNADTGTAIDFWNEDSNGSTITQSVYAMLLKENDGLVLQQVAKKANSSATETSTAVDYNAYCFCLTGYEMSYYGEDLTNIRTDIGNSPYQFYLDNGSKGRIKTASGGAATDYACCSTRPGDGIRFNLITVDGSMGLSATPKEMRYVFAFCI